MSFAFKCIEKVEAGASKWPDNSVCGDTRKSGTKIAQKSSKS